MKMYVIISLITFTLVNMDPFQNPMFSVSVKCPQHLLGLTLKYKHLGLHIYRLVIGYHKQNYRVEKHEKRYQ